MPGGGVGIGGRRRRIPHARLRGVDPARGRCRGAARRDWHPRPFCGPFRRERELVHCGRSGRPAARGPVGARYRA
eukprot:4720068-Pyramimonas_sp.AAC.1